MKPLQVFRQVSDCGLKLKQRVFLELAHLNIIYDLLQELQESVDNP